MEPGLRVKIAVYEHFATTGRRPSANDVASHVGMPAEEVRGRFAQLRADRGWGRRDSGRRRVAYHSRASPHS